VSENTNAEGINISINNSDGSGGGSGGFLDRIIDTGLKLIIPLLLLGSLILVFVIVRFILPLIQGVTSIFSGEEGDALFNLGLSTIPIFGGLASLLFGRR